MTTTDVSIEACELSVRTTNVLKNAGILTLDKLLQTPWVEIRNLPNCGARTRNEIRELLDSLKPPPLAPTLMEWVQAHEALIELLATGKAVIVPLHRLVTVRIPGDI